MHRTQHCIANADIAARMPQRDGTAPSDTTLPSLISCAADVATLFKGFEPVDWWISRMFDIEFICDQQLDYTMNERFARASDYALMRYQMPPCHL